MPTSFSFDAKASARLPLAASAPRLRHVAAFPQTRSLGRPQPGVAGSRGRRGLGRQVPIVAPHDLRAVPICERDRRLGGEERMRRTVYADDDGARERGRRRAGDEHGAPRRVDERRRSRAEQHPEHPAATV